MTEHTITVEETVEQEETVYTCEYCGLSDGAGEILHFELKSDDRLSLFKSEVQSTNEIPDLHYHVSCLPKVVNDDVQAEALTLSSEFERRTGTGLFLVFPDASVPFVAFTLFFSLWWWYNTGFWAEISAILGLFLGVLTLGLARKTANQTIKEFST